MKRPLFLICLALILQHITGCRLASDRIDRLWFYTYSEGSPDDRDSLLNPANFLECQKDGTYTRDFGHFEYGTWRMQDHKLYLTDNQHHTTDYFVDLSRPKEMRITIRGGYTASFERLPLPDKKEDPFSVENNRWRIPAAHKESDAEIRRRLYDHCRFWETYFTWALDNEVSAIDVRGTPTNIKIYGNGFTLKPLDELPAAWRSYFFDKEDYTKANDIIKEIFRTGNIAWPRTDNRYKQFIGAFQQLETFLK
ncbi:MAG TPA: hypothetical protein VHD83_11020 [Puia sp.]|nr:hypothetical protein [Puia sp.]